MEQENSSSIHQTIIITFLVIVAILLASLSAWILIRANKVRNAATFPPTETVYVRGQEINDAVEKAYEYMEDKDYQAVINLIEPQIESWSYSMNQSEAYQVLILAEINTANTEKALYYAKRLLARHQLSYNYQLMGQAYEQNQEYDKALEAYTKALSLDDYSPRTNREFIKEHIEDVKVKMNPQ